MKLLSVIYIPEPDRVPDCLKKVLKKAEFFNFRSYRTIFYIIPHFFPVVKYFLKKNSNLYNIAKTDDNIYRNSAKGGNFMERNMNRKIFFTIFASVATAGVLVICTLAQSVRNTKIQTKFAVNVPEVTQPECIVREYNGKIGVFRGESDTPYKIIDYNVNLLSDYDRAIISDGIVMESDEELRKFIEDISG